MHFIVADYLAGMLIGSLTALGVRGLVPFGTDMVVGMLVGTLVGMGVHVVLGMLMVPSSKTPYPYDAHAPLVAPRRPINRSRGGGAVAGAM